MQSVMNTYWMPTQDRETRPVSREVGLPAVAAFLDRVGRLLAQPVLVDLPEKKAKFEIITTLKALKFDTTSVLY